MQSGSTPYDLFSWKKEISGHHQNTCNDTLKDKKTGTVEWLLTLFPSILLHQIWMGCSSSSFSMLPLPSPCFNCLSFPLSGGPGPASPPDRPHFLLGPSNCPFPCRAHYWLLTTDLITSPLELEWRRSGGVYRALFFRRASCCLCLSARSTRSGLPGIEERGRRRPRYQFQQGECNSSIGVRRGVDRFTVSNGRRISPSGSLRGPVSSQRGSSTPLPPAEMYPGNFALSHKVHIFT
jgi:hypothetical protein